MFLRSRATCSFSGSEGHGAGSRAAPTVQLLGSHRQDAASLRGHLSSLSSCIDLVAGMAVLPKAGRRPK